MPGLLTFGAMQSSSVYVHEASSTGIGGHGPRSIARLAARYLGCPCDRGAGSSRGRISSPLKTCKAG